MVKISAIDSRLPMMIMNSEEVERKILLVLRVLHSSGAPLGARLIARLM